MVMFSGVINISIWYINFTPISLINLFAGLFSILQLYWTIKSHRKRIKSITHENPEIEAIVASIWNIKIQKKKWWHFRKTLYRTDSTTYYIDIPHKEFWVKYISNSGVFNIYKDIFSGEEINIKICDPDYIKQIEHNVNELIFQ